MPNSEKISYADNNGDVSPNIFSRLFGAILGGISGAVTGVGGIAAGFLYLAAQTFGYWGVGLPIAVGLAMVAAAVAIVIGVGLGMYYGFQGGWRSAFEGAAKIFDWFRGNMSENDHQASGDTLNSAEKQRILNSNLEEQEEKIGCQRAPLNNHGNPAVAVAAAATVQDSNDAAPRRPRGFN